MDNAETFVFTIVDGCSTTFVFSDMLTFSISIFGTGIIGLFSSVLPLEIESICEFLISTT